jgi:hypothetical protein
MGGQTGTQQTQTQQTTQLPPWINDAAQQNYAVAQGIATTPLQQYQGQMTPDVSQQLQQSWSTAATSANAGQPQLNASTAGLVGALGQTPSSILPQTLAGANLQPYMNPYTQNVINATLPIMQQQLGQTLATNAGNAVNQGAFGGSRFGVQQGVAQAQGALGETQMAEQLNQANYAQAVQGAQYDIGNNMTAQTANQAAQQAKINSDIAAAGGLNANAQTAGQLAQSAFNMQNTAGTQQMSTAQDQINAQMQKFQQAWGYPTQELGVLQSALGMTPYGQSTTGASDTTTYTPTNWAMLAGAGLGAAGSIFKGAGAGVLGGNSDKRLKKNLKRVGTHGPTGVPIYDYNWKGEKPGAPKTRGPMAQDVEKVLPGAVVKDAAGMRRVHPAVLGALSRPTPVGHAGALRTLSPLSHTQHRRRVRPPQLRGALSG